MLRQKTAIAWTIGLLLIKYLHLLSLYQIGVA